jgi:hypothetical protein
MKNLILILSLALGGCASILHGTHDDIIVNSLEKGSTIYVNDVARGIDMIVVDVKKGKPHQLRAEKEGCQSVTATTGEKFDVATLAGIGLDLGIFSIPIDLISGAAWRVAPRGYTLTPVCRK